MVKSKKAIKNTAKTVKKVNSTAERIKEAADIFREMSMLFGKIFDDLVKIMDANPELIDAEGLKQILSIGSQGMDVAKKSSNLLCELNETRAVSANLVASK